MLSAWHVRSRKIPPATEPHFPPPFRAYSALFRPAAAISPCLQLTLVLTRSTAEHFISLAGRTFPPSATDMAYYNDPNWASPAPGRQSSWEQPQPPSRSGTGHSGYNGGGPPSTLDLGPGSNTKRDEANAFASQFDGT